MEKMVVVVFDSESKAYEGTNALSQLDKEGSISVYAGAVIRKNADGTATVLKTNEEFPLGTVGGTAIGSLVGLLGGPYGVIIGATSGTILGAAGDLYRCGVSAEYLDEVSAKLTPGKFAVVADIGEEWITPLDVAMEKLGGQVFRTAKRDVESEQIQADLNALDLETVQLAKEEKEARSERKAKLQAKIDKLKADRQKKTAHAHQRSEQIRKEYDAKVQSLKEKAAKAHGAAKATLEARMAEMKKNHDAAVSKWKIWEGERLEKTADRLNDKARKLRMET